MPKKTPPQKLADQARSVYEAGQFLPAAQAYGEAASAYAAEGDALMSAEMKNNQSVTLLRAGQAQAALEAARGTEKTFAAAGDSRRQGMALGNQASALQALKKLDEAADLYKKSAAALEKAGEGDLRVEVMQLLSMLYLRRLKFYDAVIALQSGLAGVKNPTRKQRLMKKILFMRL
jgi:tetratricopeptide (TPR) repeat protein